MIYMIVLDLIYLEDVEVVYEECFVDKLNELDVNIVEK